MPKHCPNSDCPVLVEEGLAAEFRDDVEICPECGEALQTGPAEAAAEASRPVTGSLVTIARYGSIDEAQLAWSRLASEDIQAVVNDAQLLGFSRLFSGKPAGVKLEVRPDDAERALAVLDEEAPEEAAG